MTKTYKKKQKIFWMWSWFKF